MTLEPQPIKSFLISTDLAERIVMFIVKVKENKKCRVEGGYTILDDLQKAKDVSHSSAESAEQVLGELERWIDENAFPPPEKRDTFRLFILLPPVHKIKEKIAELRQRGRESK